MTQSNCRKSNKVDVIRDDKDVDLTHIKDEYMRKEVECLVKEYKPMKEKDVKVKMTIILKDDIPVVQSARRLSVTEKAEVDSQLRVWLNEGIVQLSYSDYASPIVLVKKKNGATRICVDYRKLNEKVVKSRYSLPLIEDQLDLLQGAKIYSTLDLKNGFFHVSVEETSRKYAAFVVLNGHYEFLKMPFGLCTSPAYFQKYINAVFRDLTAERIVAVYMDDLIVPSIDMQEGLSRLKLVLKTAAEYGLPFNWKKCQLLKSKVNYLGHYREWKNCTFSRKDRCCKTFSEADEYSFSTKFFRVDRIFSQIHMSILLYSTTINRSSEKRCKV